MYHLSKGQTLPAAPSVGNQRDTSYSSFKEVNIPLDYRMIAIGTTGSGKTTSVLNIIKKQACFSEIHLCTKIANEKTYEYFIKKFQSIEKKLKHKILYIYTDVTQMPLVELFPDVPDEVPYNRLVIFDDMQGENSKKQDLMSGFWTMGRKKRMSCVYICQSFFKAPIVIRGQSNFALFRTVNSASDISHFIQDFSLGITPEEFKEFFHEATKGHNFFLVDRDTRNPNLKFRENLGSLTA
jgi:Poxvirus A32 protein